jgi:hypothetical protein
MNGYNEKNIKKYEPTFFNEIDELRVIGIDMEDAYDKGNREYKFPTLVERRLSDAEISRSSFDAPPERDPNQGWYQPEDCSYCSGTGEQEYYDDETDRYEWGECEECSGSGESYARGGKIDKDIAKFKKQLIAKEKSRGLYENFGQKEVRKLNDKYDAYEMGDDGVKNYTKIQQFSDWASGFDGTRYARGGEVDYGKARRRLESLGLSTDAGDRNVIIDEVRDGFGIDCEEVIRASSDDDIYVAVDGLLQDYGAYSQGADEEYAKRSEKVK